ncbi:MAG: signal peptidase I [Litorilinea sp.]
MSERSSEHMQPNQRPFRPRASNYITGKPLAQNPHGQNSQARPENTREEQFPAEPFNSERAHNPVRDSSHTDTDTHVGHSSSYGRSQSDGRPYGDAPHDDAWHDDIDIRPADIEPADIESAAYPGPLWRLLLTESLQVIVPAMILALLVHLFLAQATVVYGQSMEPNLHEHERLIIDKLSYQLRAPQRHDIVVLDLPTMEELLVKRVIGLPGETVEIRHGEVFVNGAPIPEPFPHDLGFQSSPLITLGPLTYFVMGDNRENSNDSRAFGPIRRDTILGRVWLRYWPLNQLKVF